MRKISFTKMSGAGNDFVLIEAPKKKFSRSWPAVARTLCARSKSIGADGLLVVWRRGPRLEYYNADGSRAFCGNGSRCAAWWMFTRGWIRQDFRLRSSQGAIIGRVIGKEQVRIRMPSPSNIRLGLALKALGRVYRAAAIDTGVPHAVVAVRSLDDFPVVDVGRALRNHRAFAPKGANVNFVSVGPDSVRLRTYERGVEDETLACGTGAAAAALIANAWSKRASPVRIVARGGVLLVRFQRFKNGALGDVWLEGPAQIIFEGEVR